MVATPEPDEAFEALLVHLRDARGVDFTGYKRPSLTRLVNRRMRTVGVDGYAAYVDLLQVEPGELAALLDTLLINVTSVFRDPAAWEELRELLPLALGTLRPDEPVRVWSAACAKHFVPVSLQQRIFRSRRAAPAARLAALAVGGQGREATLRRATEVAFVNAPAAQLVLDARGTLALINERAERDLRLSRSDLGKPFHELELSYRPLELRGSVAAVQASREVVELHDVEWVQPSGGSTRWDVRVSPLVDEDEVFGVHLVFDDVTERHTLRTRLDQVHHELSTAYEELQSSSEELETTNEGLQSAVEELETTNEELQSTNEELETMNEELQSTNEELQTLNDELRERTLQVDEANAFLQSIVEGLEQAVAVVDADYRVQLWNTGAERLSGLRAFEAEGLSDLDLELDLPVDEIHAALRAVVVQGEDRAALEVQVTNRFGRRHTRSVAVSSLRRGRTDVRGAVVTFADSAAVDADQVTD